MVMSINTNAGAMVALQSLNATNAKLATTQLRITTGLRVGGPKDDAATFAIAQNMRGDIAGMGAVKTNLALGQSITNVAIDAGKAIADLLVEMKAKAVQASQEGLDSDSYTALHQEFTSLRNQIQSIVATAEFNGKNLIDSGASDLKVLSTVDGSTITVTKQSIDATTLGILTIALTNATTAATALTAVSQAIIDVSNALASPRAPSASTFKRTSPASSWTS
jgi:flagellin